MLSKEKKKDFDFVKEKIGKYLPLLLDFLDNNQNILDYSKNIFIHKAEEIHVERQKYCLYVIKEKLKEIFSSEEVENMKLGFENGIVANVVDHHNILNHPILISGLVMSSLDRIFHNTNDSLLVLTCGGVPFNNFFNKKGFTFKDQVFPFVTNREMHKIIHGFPKRQLDFVDSPRGKEIMKQFSKEEREFLEKYQALINSVDINTCSDFVDQLTKINYSIFKLMFEEELRERVPNLIDFELEFLATKMLRELCKKKDSFIFQAIFNRSFRNIILKEFNGIWGAWDDEKRLGTHFFWYILPNGEQARMVCKGDLLVVDNENSDFSIELSEDKILDLLDNKLLSPNIFLFFGITIFYLGIKPLTGLGSINYLSAMQKAWVKVLQDEFSNEANLIKDMDMKSLICSPIVTFRRNGNGKIINQFFADIVYDGGLTGDYLKNLSKIKFGDLMKTSLIENYEVKTPSNEKKPLKITTDDLTEEEFFWL